MNVRLNTNRKRPAQPPTNPGHEVAIASVRKTASYLRARVDEDITDRGRWLDYCRIEAALRELGGAEPDLRPPANPDAPLIDLQDVLGRPLQGLLEGPTPENWASGPEYSPRETPE